MLKQLDVLSVSALANLSYHTSVKGSVLCHPVSETPHDAGHMGSMTAAVIRV